MIRETSVAAFQQNLDDMLNQVLLCNDTVVINHDGDPIAALVPLSVFARIRRVRSRLELYAQRVAQGFEGTHQDAGWDEIESAVETIRRARR